MYSIYAGTNLIYSPSLTSRNYIVIDPTLHIENNKPSTLTFTVPTQNQRYSLLELINVNGRIPEIKVYDGQTRIFRGRLVTNEKNWLKSRTLNVEGELAYLRDVIVRPNWTHTGTVAQYFAYIIGQYNLVAESSKQFVVGSCTVTGDTIQRSTDQYTDVMTELTDKLLNQYGGYLQPRCEIVNGQEVNYLDYLEEPGAGTQTIRYGRNLLDLKETASVAPVYTRIIPLGASEDSVRLTIASVNEGKIYLDNSTAIAKYGLIEHVETYDEITSAQALKTAGQDTLDSVQPTNTLELMAIDMTLFGEGSDRLTVGKTYRILSAPHGYVESAQAGRLNRAEIKLAKISDSRYYFGNPKATLTQEAVSTNRAMSQVTKLALDNSADIDELRAQIATISGGLTEIVNYVTAESDSDGWHIRTWNNSKVDAWTTKSVTMGTWTNGEATATITLPSGISSGTIIITGDKEASYTGSITGNNLTVTARAATTFTDANLNIYIGG